jgi:hypothetical protein
MVRALNPVTSVNPFTPATQGCAIDAACEMSAGPLLSTDLARDVNFFLLNWDNASPC